MWPMEHLAVQAKGLLPGLQALAGWTTARRVQRPTDAADRLSGAGEGGIPALAAVGAVKSINLSCGRAR